MSSLPNPRSISLSLRRIDLGFGWEVARCSYPRERDLPGDGATRSRSELPNAAMERIDSSWMEVGLSSDREVVFLGRAWASLCERYKAATPNRPNAVAEIMVA